MKLTGQTSNTVYGPFNSANIGPGLYSVSFKFTKVEAYTINILYLGGDIKGSPVPNIEVFHSPVLAYHSHIVYS